MWNLGSYRIGEQPWQEKKRLNERLTLRFLLSTSIKNCAEASLKQILPDNNSLACQGSNIDRLGDSGF